jgi:hypothetical protein
MVKRLLLGSAVGVIAVVGAKAADLPVRAAPVEYVRICSLYGAGFYYLPGTDICVKIGGYVRGQYYVNNGTHPSRGPFLQSIVDNQNTRQHQNTNNFVMRARTILTMDTRAQTDWGVVRTYVAWGWTNNSPDFLADTGGGSSLYVKRGFLQWAGFTFGRALSFWDEIPIRSYTYFGLYQHDNDDDGTNLAAYTTQWGNGISTTMSVEGPRRFAIVNAPSTLPSIQGVGGNLDHDHVNVRMPDIVSNLRIDQAWGNWQVMAVLHDASAAYRFFPCNTDGTTITQSFNCGYPGDKFGWAVGTGANINLPFITKGDRFSFQFNWTKGATRYAMNQSGSNSPGYFGGNYSLGMGFLADAVLRNSNVLVNGGPQSGSLELTDVWSFVAAYEHKWTPSLKTSWYGGAVEASYNGAATNYFCTNVVNAPQAGAIGNLNPIVGAPAGAPRSCDPDFGIWYIGSRTQWNIRPDFYLGADVVYQRLETSFAGLAAYTALGGAPRPSSGPLYKIEDQDALSFTLRVHRDIIP